MLACIVTSGCGVYEGETIDYICKNCEGTSVLPDINGDCITCEKYSWGSEFPYCESCAEESNICMMCGRTFSQPH